MKNRTPVICDRCRAAGYLGEGPFSELAPLLDFKPVPRKRNRHDGWTPERQRAFIEALARTGSVSQAAEAVNMAKEGAYQLRLADGAEEFRAAWDKALDFGTRILADAALDRAIHGVKVPIMHQGEEVGERRVFNERLTMWQLQHRMPEKFGAPPGKGTKAPETSARERWEQGKENRQRGEVLLLIHYANRVQAEREERRAGNIENADFYARQLTHIEVMLESAGNAKHMVDIALGHADPKRPWLDADFLETWSTPLTDGLAKARAEAWARIEAGEDPLPQTGHEAELRALAARGSEDGE